MSSNIKKQNGKKANVVSLMDRARTQRINILLQIVSTLNVPEQIIDLYKILDLQPHAGRDANYMWPPIIAMLVMNIDAMQIELTKLRKIIEHPLRDGEDGDGAP